MDESDDLEIRNAGENLKQFTPYLDGNEVYAKPVADALEADLQPLVGGKLITRIQERY